MTRPWSGQISAPDPGCMLANAATSYFDAAVRALAWVGVGIPVAVCALVVLVLVISHERRH